LAAFKRQIHRQTCVGSSQGTSGGWNELRAEKVVKVSRLFVGKASRQSFQVSTAFGLGKDLKYLWLVRARVYQNRRFRFLGKIHYANPIQVFFFLTVTQPDHLNTTRGEVDKVLKLNSIKRMLRKSPRKSKT
jgi:hypothetical protein